MPGNKIALKNLKDWNPTEYIIWPNIVNLERITHLEKQHRKLKN